MTEQVKDQSFRESFESEGTENEPYNFGNSKIKYTRALLLRFKLCRKLPRDFNVLILRELNGESDGTIEKIASGHDSLPRTTWNFGLSGEKWGNPLKILDKESHLQRICSLEGRNVARQQLPREDSYSSGFLCRNPLKSDLSQLSKAANPYRPPHCTKKILQPSVDISEPGKESSQGSDEKTSADSTTGIEENGFDVPLVGDNDSTKEPLGDCEDSCENTEENEVFIANETLKEIIEEVLEDNQLTFDDLWADVLETMHIFQQDSPDSAELEIRFCNKAKSEDETSLPDEDSLISDPEAEIVLPDEDSLISIYDLIGPDSLMAISNSEVNKITSNNMRNKLETPFHFPGLMSQGQMHPPHTFGPEKSSLPPMLMIPNIAPCSMTSYSVLQQPNIFPSRLTRRTKAVAAEWNVNLLPSVRASSYQGFGSSKAGGFVGNEEARGFSLWHSQF